MKSLKSITIKASMLAAMTIVGSLAQAATWVDVGPASGFSIAGSTVTYSPSPALIVKYYDDNLVPQSPSGIQGYINSVFGSTLGAAVSSCDNATSGCTAGTTASFTAGVNSYTSSAAYDYLAIHFGKGELVFNWATPIAAGTTFTVAGLPKDLSNYRAFISAVPEPATYAMLLAGLGILGFLSRRRSAK
jgi:PEP-CTERM motif